MKDSQIVEVYNDTGSMRATARKLGVSWRTVKKCIDRAGIDITTPLTIEGRAKDVEQLLDAHGLDPAKWVVTKVVVGQSDVTMKGKKTLDSGVPTSKTVANKNFKVTLKPRLVTWQERVLAASLPAYPEPQDVVPYAKHQHALVLSLSDIHFGKLAWAMETGEAYDLGIARKATFQAAGKAMSRVGHLEFDEIVLPVGNDFFNIDTLFNTTTSGTPQDSDSRLFKIFTTGQAVIESIILGLANLARVKVLYVPGNHDWATSWFLCNVLQALYRYDERITVDCNPTNRKYWEYGNSLVGFSHGDKERMPNYPQIMADEMGKAWGRTAFHEMHVGHFHRERQVHYTGTDTFGGTIVRVAPSLSGTDAWHYHKGYVKTPKKVLAHAYHKEDGHVLEASGMPEPKLYQRKKKRQAAPNWLEL